MLKSVVHVTTRGQVDICSLCCGQKPCRSPWSVLSLIVNDKEASFAVVLMYWWLQIHNWGREREMFYGNLSPRTHPRNSLYRKPLKWTLKNCDRDAKVQLNSSRFMGSGIGRSGEELSFLKELALRVWPCFSEYLGNTKWTWLFPPWGR